MMGVNSSPAGAFAVPGVPLTEFTDAHIDVASLWGDSIARELRDRLCTATSPRGALPISRRRPDRATPIGSAFASGRAVRPAICADILQIRARVLVISGGTSVYAIAVLCPKTALSALLN